MSNLKTRTASGDPAGKLLRGALMVGVSALATSMFAAPAFAQDATAVQTNSITTTEADDEEIVVTGIRAALEAAMDIKRESIGVVDAISAEDIGKFPDTNLAESLQRIPGVSIDRRNGEGSQVTVRGFGPAFNLVTVNGRQMATSDVNTVGGDLSVDFGRATSRSFDFSNLASEGVSRLEVYKTGRAAIPSGGIGAAINVVTQRPLDASGDGLRGSIGAKGLYDTSADFKITPEVSGVATWSDPTEMFGVSVFGAYQKRESAAASATVNGWSVQPFSDMPGRVPSTVFTNAPSEDQLVAIPDDSRYHYSEFSRERLNGQVTLQFRPMETLTLTADALYAQNKVDEERAEQTNWFSRPFTEVTFDDDDVVATAINLREELNPVKDIGFESVYRATKSRLDSYGLNADWEIADGFTLNLDAATSRSRSTPNADNGTSSTLVGIGAPVVTAHSVDFTGDVPQQTWEMDDSIWGNGNGVLDLGDLGTAMGRTNTSSQRHRLNQFRADLGWELDAGTRFDVGTTYVDSKMTSARVQTQQTLGNWGSTASVGDIEQFAPGLVEQYCLQCQFDHYDPTNAEVAFRANAVDLMNIFSPLYAADGSPLIPGTQAGNSMDITGNEFDRVREKVWAGYAQLTWAGEIGGREAGLTAGVRYENTKVTSFAEVDEPAFIRWESDNDFRRGASGNIVGVTLRGEYNNLLPAVDFHIEPMEDVVARVSYSKTLARPDYGNLFASQSANAPPDPTFLGARATGTSGNPGLRPLVSDNFDVSLEWYYGRSSYVSAGFFAKKVKNFVGQGQVEMPLFGLRDPSSGAPGSRSGDAAERLAAEGIDVTNVNLYTLTGLLVQNGGDIDAAWATFDANFDYAENQLDGDFVQEMIEAVDIVADANDPLFNFFVSTPINNRAGNIHGFEIQGQHFFGETGFGISGSFTKVYGDVNVDRGSDPNEDVFALVGLSDSFNITGIYDNGSLSARVAYNWRDKFLSGVNRGATRNPVFVDSFGTLDLNVSYDVNEQIALSFEAINLLSEPLRTYGRSERQLWSATELKPRFLLGARYRF